MPREDLAARRVAAAAAWLVSADPLAVMITRALDSLEENDAQGARLWTHAVGAACSALMTHPQPGREEIAAALRPILFRDMGKKVGPATEGERLRTLEMADRVLALLPKLAYGLLFEAAAKLETAAGGVQHVSGGTPQHQELWLAQQRVAQLLGREATDLDARRPDAT